MRESTVITMVDDEYRGVTVLFLATGGSEPGGIELHAPVKHD